MKTIPKYGLLLIFCAVLFAQGLSQSPPCAFDRLQGELMNADEAYRMEIQNYREQILPALQVAQRTTSDILTIPVVIHVIHTGQSLGMGANLSETRILSQLEILNQDYRRINDDMDLTPTDYAGIAADTEIQFCLVRVDPSGIPTNGVTRHIYTDINSIDDIENTIKPETIWDPSRYLNIWTIEIPDNSVLGYSYLPTGSMVGSNRDGVVIDYQRFGYQDEDSRGRTCIHEVGHYLGLQHPWGANNSDGEPLGCDSDDGVGDTPTSEVPYYGCPSFGISSCGSVDMVMNYMEYVNDDCMNLFTEGQKNVMHGILSGVRADLVDNGLTACEEVEFGCLDIAQSIFEMGFEATDSQDGWVVENTNMDNRSWLITQNVTSDWGPNNGDGLAVYLWNVDGTTSGDDYLFTPCFDLQAGHKYRFRFSFAAAEDNSGVYPENFEVGFSQQQSSEDFVVPEESWVYESVQNAYPAYEVVSLEFVAEDAQPLSIGFHVYSPADRYALQIDDVRLEDLGLSTSVELASVPWSVRLAPNPTAGVVFLTLEGSMLREDLRINIFNTVGELIRSVVLTEPTAESWRIDLGDQAPGIYWLQMESEGFIQTKRLVVVR